MCVCSSRACLPPPTAIISLLDLEISDDDFWRCCTQNASKQSHGSLPMVVSIDTHPAAIETRSNPTVWVRLKSCFPRLDTRSGRFAFVSSSATHGPGPNKHAVTNHHPLTPPTPCIHTQGSGKQSDGRRRQTGAVAAPAPLPTGAQCLVLVPDPRAGQCSAWGSLVCMGQIPPAC